MNAFARGTGPECLKDAVSIKVRRDGLATHVQLIDLGHNAEAELRACSRSGRANEVKRVPIALEIME